MATPSLHPPITPAWPSEPPPDPDAPWLDMLALIADLQTEIRRAHTTAANEQWPRKAKAHLGRTLGISNQMSGRARLALGTQQREQHTDES